MASPDYDFLKRVRSLDQQLGGEGKPPPDVVRTQIAQYTPYLSSRERAPSARHFGTLPAPAAGVHCGIMVTGVDAGGPLTNCNLILHDVVMSGASTFALLAPSAVTLASSTALTPMSRDLDPELTPQLFHITIATADIPAGAPGTGVCGVMPNNGFSNQSAGVLPMAIHWTAPERAAFFILNAAATAAHFRVQWQTVRL